MVTYRNIAYYILLVGFVLDLSLLPLANADDHSDDQRLFRAHCGKCHGFQGEGGEGPTLTLAKLPRASTPELLADIIAMGIPNTGMPGSSLDKDQIRQIVAYVRQQAEVPAGPVAGDAKRGERIYFTKADCTTCHAIKGQGGTLGPDLTKIGQRRGAAHLRTSLVDPEADVPKSFLVLSSGVSIVENFLQVTLVTSRGRSIEGVRVNEDTFSIQVRDADEKLHSFLKSELVEIDKHWGKSPMSSYRDVLSKEELDDVVAFLVSLRGQ